MRISKATLLLTMTIAGSAAAGRQTNGIQANGIQANGIQANGTQINGIQANGIQANGIQANGIQANGIVVNGIQANGIQANGIGLNGVGVNGTQLEGSFIGFGTTAMPNTCSHREDLTGAALNNCSPCAVVVGDADGYCRASSWDSICVSRAQSTCRATITTGTTLQANFSNGQTAGMTITRRVQQGWTYTGSAWVNNSDVWWNTVNWQIPHAPNVTGVAMPAATPNACVRRVVASDSYCGTTSWDSICVSEAANWCTSGIELQQKASVHGDSVCGYDAGGNALEAIFIRGLWDMNSGYQGAGGKRIKTPVGQFTMACRRVGAIAKCVDFGYKPWTSSEADQLHQSCVRAVRDDLCGDGHSFTADGEVINITDFRGIQADTEIWNIDATFTPNGAVYVSYGGRSGGPSGMTAYTDYVASHSYCAAQTTHVYNSNWGAAWMLDGSPNQIRVERVVCGYEGGTPCP